MRDLNLPGRPDSGSSATLAPKKPKGRPRKQKPEQSTPAATSDDQSVASDESKSTEGIPGEDVPPTFETPTDATSGEKPVRKRRRGGGPGSRGGSGRGRGRGRGASTSTEPEATEHKTEPETTSEAGDEPPISRPRLTARLRLQPAARSRSSSASSESTTEEDEAEPSPTAEPDDVSPHEQSPASLPGATEPETSSSTVISSDAIGAADNTAESAEAKEDNADRESVSGELEEARNIIAPGLISRSGRHIVPNPKFFS